MNDNTLTRKEVKEILRRSADATIRTYELEGLLNPTQLKKGSPKLYNKDEVYKLIGINSNDNNNIKEIDLDFSKVSNG